MGVESSTEALRRMLDERGVEHEDDEDVTRFFGPDGFEVVMQEDVDCRLDCLTPLYLTPEQAIAATLGDADATGERQRDAVEVVRCRDCKHMYEHDLSAYYGNHEYDQCSCCRLLDPGAISVEPDGFCAWGERKEVDA